MGREREREEGADASRFEKLRKKKLEFFLKKLENSKS
jgi:hypothetical protein